MTYTIGRDGRQLGVYSREEVQRQVNDGRLLATDLAWPPDEQRWTPLAELLAPPAPGSLDEAALSAFVGEKYFTYYKARWAGLDAPRRSAWNWAALFAGPFWIAYRKMYAYVWVYAGLVVVADVCELVLGLSRFAANGVFLVIATLIAGQGNYWYKDHVARRVAAVKPVDLERLAAEGGTSATAAVALIAGYIAYVVAFSLLAGE